MDEAAARRERLKALKAAQQLVEGDAAGVTQAAAEPAAAEPEKPVLKFRNYTVKDEQHIQHEKVRPQHPQVHASLATGSTTGRLEHAQQLNTLCHPALGDVCVDG
jgi:hypothetical protein